MLSRPRTSIGIQELVPEFEPTLTALEAVELPGILQDKQASVGRGEGSLMELLSKV